MIFKCFIGEICDVELGDDIKVGDKVVVDIFVEGEMVDVIGIIKGYGY